MVSLLLVSWCIVIGLISARLPRLGLAIAILAIPSYLVRFVVGVPTNLFEVTLLGVLVGYLASGGYKRIREFMGAYRPIFIPIIVLTAGLVVGVFASQHIMGSLGIVKGWFIVPLILFGLVVRTGSGRSVELILWSLLVSTLPISVLALWQAFTGLGVTTDGRISAWFASPNYLALYVVPIVLLCTYLLRVGSLTQRVTAGVIAGIGLLAVMMSFSYGGWLGLGVGLLVLLSHTYPRQRALIFLGAVGAAVIGFLSQAGNPRFQTMLDLTTQSSASVRMQVWATDLLMLREHWLTGIGLGEFPTKYLEFVSRVTPHPLETAILHGHNLFLQFGLEMGLLGWLFLLALGITIAKWARRGRDPLLYAAIAALAAIVTHGLVDTSYWKNDLAAVFWVLIAIIYLRYTQGRINPKASAYEE